MVQNRNKLIELFIGNASNSIVHRILEKAIAKERKEEISDKYRKELITSFELARGYREKINPVNLPLPTKDILYIKNRIIKKATSELMIRISKGYRNIDIGLVEKEVDDVLRDYSKLGLSKSRKILSLLSYDELLDLENIKQCLGLSEDSEYILPKGHRILEKAGISEKDTGIQE